MEDSKQTKSYYYADDADKTVRENECLIYYILNKKIHRSDLVSDEDIIQCGRLGIFKAWKSHDASKSSWATYVTKVIINEILMELRKRGNSNNYFYSNCDHLNKIIEDGRGGACELQDLLIFEDHSFDAIISEHGKIWNMIYDSLSTRDKKIIHLMDLNYTQKEIGEILGISQSYASRLILKLKKDVLKKWKEMNDN